MISTVLDAFLAAYRVDHPMEVSETGRIRHQFEAKHILDVLNKFRQDLVRYGTRSPWALT